MFNPFLQVGRDYFGDSFRGLREFVALENAIAECHPRFRDDTPLHDRDFASGYIFSFLEAFVAEVAMKGEDWSPGAPSVERCVSALVAEIEAESWEIACCREVSHLTTASGEPLEFSDVTVIPLLEPPGGHRREAGRAIAQVIPHSQSSYSRMWPSTCTPPHSIVVARDNSTKPFDSARTLSSRINQFMLVARLLHAGTCDSLYEVQGETSLVRQFKPELVHFRGAGGLFPPSGMLRRTTRLEPPDVKRFADLTKAIAEAEGEPQGLLVTSFGMATHKFQISYHAHSWSEQLVDLATAFEAALSGTAKTDVLLRLKTRASALLATENDPVGAIFKDIGILYDLRSRLIHGSTISEKHLIKSARSITTVPDDSRPGIAIAHVVDRLRDLVRRALLARIALAVCEPPLWDFNRDEGVDAQLVDASTRDHWCTTWREILRSFDAHESVNRPRTAVEYISREDL